MGDQLQNVESDTKDRPCCHRNCKTHRQYTGSTQKTSTSVKYSQASWHHTHSPQDTVHQLKWHSPPYGATGPFGHRWENCWCVWSITLFHLLQFKDLESLNLWCGVPWAEWPTCQSTGLQDVKQWSQRDSRSTCHLSAEFRGACSGQWPEWPIASKYNVSRGSLKKNKTWGSFEL